MKRQFDFYKKQSLSYFEAFAKKDIKTLNKLFDESVTLRDWDIASSGIKDVIKFIDSIFIKLETIVIKPINIAINGNIVFAEIDILIDNKENLFVVDILEFNKQGKIISIRAFKG